MIADIFYTKLFNDSPRLRKLFPDNMQLQYSKLMDMLTAIITQLDRFEAISEEITAMGKRHDGYGIKPHHYELVGNALLWTLKQVLDVSWTTATSEAWAQCYNDLVLIMTKR
ncbi:globin domain-containing protein [Ferruginibacter sp.]